MGKLITSLSLGIVLIVFIGCASTLKTKALLRPTKIPSGWTFHSESSQLGFTQVWYSKGKTKAILIIEESAFRGSAKTKEEYRDKADEKLEISMIVFRDMLESKITAKLSGEKIVEVNGHPCYGFFYDIIGKDGNSPVKARAWYFWYCDRMQKDCNAQVSIQDEPISDYISEAKEMIKSIKCH